MKFLISPPSEAIDDTIRLPSSKSISNRLLIIDAMAGGNLGLKNLAESDDTRVMVDSLSSGDLLKDIGHAGTAMRFLTAYYSVSQEEVIMTGSERMRNRPIGELVKALRHLGADITYLEKEHYPPLRIRGRQLTGGDLTVNGSISSQFISALLMIAPGLQGGLRLELQGNIVSAAYIKMTLELMHRCGISYIWKGNRITVKQGNYSTEEVTVESDWSAASYWYALAALSSGSKIELPGLFSESLQGDAVLREIFGPLGVTSEFGPDGVVIQNCADAGKAFWEYDFTLCPDLVQTMAALLCARDIPFRFTGTRTLRIKETDRIVALQKELGKLGYLLRSDHDGNFLEWQGETKPVDPGAEIETYHDHRMAMAFAPLALKFGQIVILDPQVVTKSYPRFWEDLSKVGFIIEEI